MAGIWYVLKEKDIKTMRMISIGIWIIWKNQNLAAHGNKAWSLDQCRLKINYYITQFDSKIIVGCGPFGDIDPADCEGLSFFSGGSWSGRIRDGGWAAIAFDGNMKIRLVVWHSSECISGLDVELHGIITALRLANDLGCRSANFLSDCVEAIWSLHMGYGKVMVFRSQWKKIYYCYGITMGGELTISSGKEMQSLASWPRKLDPTTGRGVFEALPRIPTGVFGSVN